MKFTIGDEVEVISGVWSGNRGVVGHYDVTTNTYTVDFVDQVPNWTGRFAEAALKLASTTTILTSVWLAAEPLTYHLGDYGHNSYTSDDQKKKWKEEGRCEECGTLLPMSIWGLGECPNHPKPGGPQ